MLFFSYCNQFRHKCDNFGAIIDQPKVTDSWQPAQYDFPRNLLFTDINFTGIIFTEILIFHAKASSVQVMSVIVMSDNVVLQPDSDSG